MTHAERMARTLELQAELMKLWAINDNRPHFVKIGIHGSDHYSSIMNVDEQCVVGESMTTRWREIAPGVIVFGQHEYNLS